MNTPEYFQMDEGYSCYRPVGEGSFQEAVDLISGAVAFARERGVKRLMVNITQWTGAHTPGTWERFYMAEEFARVAKSSLVAVMVARAEFIDPRRFGVTVARNRGLFSNVFTTEEEALAWLQDPNAL